MRINEDYSNFNEHEKLFEFKGLEQQDEFISLPLERISELEKDYRYYNHVSMGCKLSMVMSGRYPRIKPEDYVMILLPDISLYANPDLFEGLIRTTEADTVINLLPKEIAKYLIAPEWVQMMHVAPESCVIQMKKYYLLDKNQIYKVNLPDGINYIHINVPAIAENLEIVEKSMNLFGYYLNEKIDNHKINGNDKWFLMEFEPKFQPFITAMLKENHKFLYHVSPSKYRHKILKNGLIPKSNNDKFNFPTRVYLMMDNRNGETTTVTDMRDVAMNLLSAMSNPIYNEYFDDYKWSLYKIDISKLSDTVNFCFDENYYPLAVFSSDNINPDAIKYVTEFDFSYRKNKK